MGMGWIEFFHQALNMVDNDLTSQMPAQLGALILKETIQR
jgi:hypothetical protein